MLNHAVFWGEDRIPRLLAEEFEGAGIDLGGARLTNALLGEAGLIMGEAERDEVHDVMHWRGWLP
jgi:hypothetical protein